MTQRYGFTQFTASNYVRSVSCLWMHSAMVELPCRRRRYCCRCCCQCRSCTWKCVCVRVCNCRKTTSSERSCLWTDSAMIELPGPSRRRRCCSCCHYCRRCTWKCLSVALFTCLLGLCSVVICLLGTLISRFVSVSV